MIKSVLFGFSLMSILLSCSEVESDCAAFIYEIYNLEEQRAKDNFTSQAAFDDKIEILQKQRDKDLENCD